MQRGGKMKMCKEIEEAIVETCNTSGDSDEVKNILRKMIQNNLDNNLSDDEIPTFIDKMVVKDENWNAQFADNRHSWIVARDCQ